MAENNFIEAIEAHHETFQDYLDIMVRIDNLDAFKALCEYKGSINILTWGKSSLAVAVQAGSLRIFEFLLDQPNLEVDLTTTYKATALVNAIEGFCKAEPGSQTQLLYRYFIHRLLEKGADINLLNVDGHGPLFRACIRGSDEGVHMLLSHGADPSIPSKKGFLPYQAAASSSCSDHCIEMLFRLSHQPWDPVTIPLVTISHLIQNNHVGFLVKILLRVIRVQVPDPESVQYLVTQLHKLSFALFIQITERFGNILDTLKTCDDLDLGPIVKESPDVADYLRFICQNCRNLSKFDASCLLQNPGQISYELLYELLSTLLSHGRPLRLDMDELYGLYQFSPLFEELQHRSLICVKDMKKPSFVPVWYNFTDFREPPWYLETVFEDQRFYFAGKGEVPSLLQVTRDAFREKLREDYNIQNNLKLYKLIDKLPIFDDFKDILQFKRKIYS